MGAYTEEEKMNFTELLDKYMADSRELVAAILEKENPVKFKCFIVGTSSRSFYGAVVDYGLDYLTFLTTNNETVIIPLDKINYITREAK